MIFLNLVAQIDNGIIDELFAEGIMHYLQHGPLENEQELLLAYHEQLELWLDGIIDSNNVTYIMLSIRDGKEELARQAYQVQTKKWNEMIASVKNNELQELEKLWQQ